MSTTNFYLYMKHGFGLRKAFRFAYGITLRDAVLNLMFYGAILALLATLVYFTTNQYAEAQEATARHRTAYVTNLEQTLVKCLTPGDNALWIGDELAFCGTTYSGVKK